MTETVIFEENKKGAVKKVFFYIIFSQPLFYQQALYIFIVNKKEELKEKKCNIIYDIDFIEIILT